MYTPIPPQRKDDFVWVTLPNDGSGEIYALHFGKESKHSFELKLPITDSRVVAYFDKQPKRKVIKWRVNTLEQLNALAYMFDVGQPKPVYRGQSDYSWKLETRLERVAPPGNREEFGLEQFEYQTIIEARRRLHHHLEALPDKEDFFSWLALLRHYGVPTRLLDVSKSIFVACYFALNYEDKKRDAALWIFPRFHLESTFDRWSSLYRDSIVRAHPFTLGQSTEYYWPLPENFDSIRRKIDYEALLVHKEIHNLNYSLVLDAAMRGYIDRCGMGLAEPFWLTKRIDAQQGTFMIPFNMRNSFEENLFSYLSLDQSQDLISDLEETDVPCDYETQQKFWSDAPAFKIRIAAEVQDLIRVRLSAMNVRELTLFPDVEGSMQHISTHVPLNRA